MYAMQMCTKQHTMPCIRPANGKTLPLFMHTFLPFAYCLFRFVCFFFIFNFYPENARHSQSPIFTSNELIDIIVACSKFMLIAAFNFHP